MRTQKWLRCFECESKTANIHWHHVVPHSLGGTKCIPLCEVCHSITHDTNLKNSNLIKLGLIKAKEKGKILGRPKGSTLSIDEFTSKHNDIVNYLNDGMSIRNVARITKKGCSTVQRVKKVLNER